ncbi:hypothetical protein [Tissierella praeacuta]|uniref:hypothetical protein n=1 Tax=Tissierella praeacuta TaxID=43131 RepID=UPI0033402391
MDLDILMEALNSIDTRLSNAESELSSISSNTSDAYYLNEKLDKIIGLLEKIAKK